MSLNDDINLGQITEALNGKIDLPDNVSQSDCHFVVESYVNGTSWYRVYSDGWCEQGGRSTINANTWTTVNLLKAYKDTNYNALACEFSHQAANDWGGQQGVQPLTTSSIRIATGLDSQADTTWVAFGYIS